jgi:hypothetical protein
MNDMEEWSKNLKIELMKKITYEAFKKATNNEEILIIGWEMFLEHGSIHEDEVESKLIEIIKEELKEDNLIKWQDSDKGIRRRRNQLDNFLLCIERRNRE